MLTVFDVNYGVDVDCCADVDLCVDVDCCVDVGYCVTLTTAYLTVAQCAQQQKLDCWCVGDPAVIVVAFVLSVAYVVKMIILLYLLLC